MLPAERQNPWAAGCICFPQNSQSTLIANMPSPCPLFVAVGLYRSVYFVLTSHTV